MLANFTSDHSTIPLNGKSSYDRLPKYDDSTIYIVSQQSILYMIRSIYVYVFTKYLSFRIYTIDGYYKHLNMYVDVFAQGK